jgi:23S rRNA (adenine2503-C2)-methyltransferase
MPELWDKIRVLDSSDQNVKKYVFEREDAVAESVLYKYPTYDKRTVICCSTQSGCPIGCRFCGAGDNFVRSLTAEEIFSQPFRLLQDTGVDPLKMERLQIMFMSMGEPLLNLSNLIPALEELHKCYPNAALLISTSGPRVKYDRLMDVSVKIPTIGLQFSIHESTDEARNKLIPFQAKLTLAEIAVQGKKWFDATGRTPFFNYCVHERNNTPEDVERLRALFDPEVWQATISVICERDEHVAAANIRQRSLAEEFQGGLRSKGFRTRVFDPAGQDDIGGGCGMLWYVQDWMKKHPEQSRPSVGHGLPKVHTPGGPLSLELVNG